MTVQTNTNVAIFNGNGVTQIFPIAFKFSNNADLVVALVEDSTSLVVPLSLNSDYTVTGAGAEEGGLINVVTAPAVGRRLVVTRVVDILQLRDFRNQGKFFAEVHEDALDLLTMIAQQHQYELSRSLRVPDYDPTPKQLPPAAGRANLLMGFDSEGDPIAVAPASGSAADLALSLANATNVNKGSGQVGHNGGTVRDALVGLGSQLDGVGASVGSLEQASLTQFGISDNSHNSVNGILAAQNPWGVRCLNIFGDSISFGANAQDIERNSWVGIFKKMLNIEFGSTNIGVLNIVSQSSNDDGVYKQYFEVASSQTGTWSSLTGASASHIPFGFALQSSVAGSTQNLKCPLSQRYMRVWYDGTVTGEIEVVINSVVVQTIVTNGTGTGYDRGGALELGTLVASNKGVCTFTLRCKSGTIRLTGLEFTNDTSGNSFRVHNFSRDGRAGKHVGQNVINVACAGAYGFVWALGVNDIPGFDATALAEYTQRIDWIIAAATANRTRVIFVDMLYRESYDHPLRQQIRRGAKAIKGAILVEADQVWTVSGAQYSEAERVQRGLSSGVHPEEVGHRLIAEAVAKRMGLSVTSKREAILRHHAWNALDISATAFVNSSTVPGVISGYRISDRAIEVVVNLTTVPAATVTLGTIPASAFPSGFQGLNLLSNPDINGRTCLFTITSSGDVVCRPNPLITGTLLICSLYATIPYNDSLLWF